MIPSSSRQTYPNSWRSATRRGPRVLRRSAFVATQPPAKERRTDARSLRTAIADKTERFYGHRPDAETEVTVVGDPAEALYHALRAVTSPGDEIIVFEPFAAHYTAVFQALGIAPRVILLHEPQWRIDFFALGWAFTPRTRALLLNTPHDPTGKVFSQEELELIATLCRKWDVTAISEELDEHLTSDEPHLRLADQDGMRTRTVTINRLSPTPGIPEAAGGPEMRLTWLVAPPALTEAIRWSRAELPFSPTVSLSAGGLRLLSLPDEVYAHLSSVHQSKRDFLRDALRDMGFRLYPSAGTASLFADVAVLGHEDSASFARLLAEDTGLDVTAGAHFYFDPSAGRTKLRFHYGQSLEALAAAVYRLRRLVTQAADGGSR